MKSKIRSFFRSITARNLAPEEIKLHHLVPPILGESILRTTVGLINIAFLSRISDSMVSAVSISNQYIMLCQTIASAVATGTIVCINQAVGMKNTDGVGKMSTIAVAANAVLGLLFGAFFVLLARPFLTIMSISERSMDIAVLYMQIVGGAMTVQCVEMVLSNICRSLGKTRVPLLLNLIMNLVNILGCWLVIYQPIPIPVSAVVGVAAINVLSKVAGLIFAAMIVIRAKVQISLKFLKPFPWKEFKLALSIGIPGGANNLAYSSSQLVTTAIISRTGETMIAAKVYVTNLVHYVALIGMACAQAAVILIGYRIGAGKYEEAMGLRARVTRIALISNIACSLLLAMVRIPLLRMFTQDEVIISIASAIMLIDLFVEIGRALNNTLSGALQATGDVVFQLVVNQASGWLIAVGLAYVLGILCGWGLYGVWIAFALDEAARGLTLLFRWRSKKWLPKAMARRSIINGEAKTTSA